jgi:hypothetical protein
MCAVTVAAVLWAPETCGRQDDVELAMAAADDSVEDTPDDILPNLTTISIG